MRIGKSTYQFSTDLFLRMLGAVYLIAFYSLSSQLHGLVGQYGILPVGDFLVRAEQQVGWSARWYLPTLCWWFPGDGALTVISMAGMVFAGMLILGLVPLFACAALWILYLSLTVAGQTFLSFQWDNLLLECGLLAILLAPPVWRSRPTHNPRSSRIVIFLLHLLLFKLMFMSGSVKLASGDASWRNLTALTYHFWTQPLPVWVAWYADQAPLWLLKAATAAMLLIELVVAFFVFLPRYFRYAAFLLFIALQLGIIATGNFGFFNLLSIVLCVPLLDDRVYTLREEANNGTPSRWLGGALSGMRVAAAVLMIVVNAALLIGMVLPNTQTPRPVRSLVGAVSPLRSVNPYGLFATMTKTRPEIVIEGSIDGQNWRPYEFPSKPGDPYRTPLFTAPHMPRLDWQLWFAALGNYQSNPWFFNLLVRLLEGRPEVLSLLEVNPFPDQPPLMLRAVLYEYTFARPEQNRSQFLWWNRELKGLYCPVLNRNP